MLLMDSHIWLELFERRLSFELEVSKSDSLLWLRILRRIWVLLGLQPPSGDEEGFWALPIGNCLLVGGGALVKPDKV
jgi:hypothetical protein